MQETELLSELVRFDSISSTSNVAITDYVEDQLKAVGCSIERVDYDDVDGVRKSNVIGKLGSGQGGMAYFRGGSS